MERLRRLIRPKLRDDGYRALNDLDRKLEAFLDFDHGFFVEAGANDGLSQSNTYCFERHRGWRGLLIEPIPELAARCRAQRPSATVVSCALGSFAQDGTSVRMTYCNLMSIVQGAMGSSECDGAHLAAGRDVQRITQTYEVEVPCRALESVFAEHRVHHVDLLSLDVEGYELEVLRGMDFDRVLPVHVLVEARNPSELRAMLAPRYEELAQLSYHDYLFRVRAPHAEPVAR